MNTVLSMIVAICYGLNARTMTCESAAKYFGTMHFNANHGGDLCVRLMLSLSGKSGSLREEWGTNGAIYCTAHMN